MSKTTQTGLRQLWRTRLHEIIFEAETPAGRAFDVALIAAICFSVMAVLLESVATIRQNYGPALNLTEWCFTLLFTFEYFIRLLCVRQPWRYALSFFGIVDLLAILPTFISLFLPGTHYLLVIRILRLLRVFRIFKLAGYLSEAHVIRRALWASQKKISVFLMTVVALVVIIGSLIYVIEGEENGFANIPVSIYWAIVTLTTVGYGDISPQTPIGKMLASVVMIAGYGIIAVPTGIVTVEFSQAMTKGEVTTEACPNCGAEGHDPDARYCKYCSARL